MNNKFQECAYTKFLINIPPFSKEMTLDGIKALLHQLDDFHENLKIIHIAGTNGKGSSVKMLSSIYKNAGYKVAAFTSPFIEDYKDGIYINDQVIDTALMNLATEKVSKAYQQLIDKNLPLPTQYECITVIALLSMYLEHVDLAIIEVLMGGLNDATNVFSRPLLTLITSISLDHTQYLGETVELIASQKAGIIKLARPVVLNKNKASVQTIVQHMANQKTGTYYYSETYLQTIYRSKDLDEFKQSLSLHGLHQIHNLKGVLTAIHILQDDYPVNKDHIIKGLRSVSHPCRLESILSNSMEFIIDGSHNEEGINALVTYIKGNHQNKNLVFVLGMLNDKDQTMIQKHIYSIADEVILTTPHNARAFNPRVFYQTLSPSEQKISSVIPEINDVYSQLVNNKNQVKNTLFIVCGSLYLAFPLRQLLLPSL